MSTPTRPRVSTVDVDLLRDVVSVLLIVAGFVGLVYAAFLWCDPAGYAVLSAATVLTGVMLGYRRR